MTAPDENIVFLSSPDRFTPFQELYLQVRTKENRLLDDEIVKELPYTNKVIGSQLQEWHVRANTCSEIKKYLSKVKSRAKVLDLGCGNGWLSAQLAQLETLDVTGLDINLTELEQAARIFSSPNLHFCFGNIFEDIFEPETFDFILLNASIQYFENLPLLFDRLFFFLKKEGEIHIMDSPMYLEEEVWIAKQRSKDYYASMGFPAMASHYYHHSYEELSFTNYEILNNKKTFQKITNRVLNRHHETFPWIRIRNVRNS